MRLSEAIRLGTMMKPQGKHLYFDGVKTCALGAACDAVGLLDVPKIEGITKHLFHAFPQLRSFQRCPHIGCVRPEDPFCTIIAEHLNDTHGWTREAIADWVESIEPPALPREAAAAVEELEEVKR